MPDLEDILKLMNGTVRYFHACHMNSMQGSWEHDPSTRSANPFPEGHAYDTAQYNEYMQH